MCRRALCLILFVFLSAHAHAQAQRTAQYTPRGAEATAAWQADLRTRFLALLELADLVAQRDALPFDARELGQHSWGVVNATELELRTTPGRTMKVLVAQREGLREPAPAVVAIHGHGGNRWSVFDLNAPIYKLFGTALAEAGYVVITVDVGQHEVYESGRTLMGERLWDLMRCVDYLQSLPEVDPARIGTAGLSLGGEMAMWLGAMDTRIAAEVSSGFLTVMDQMEENHCMCWKFEGLRELVDFPDLYAMTAPRALQCQNGLREPETQFNVPLARRAFAEIEPAYAAFGAGARLELHVHEGGHEVDLPALRAFLDKHLAPRG